MEIREGGLDDPQVVELLAIHAGGMLANSPVDACHFLDLSALRAPEIVFLSAWEGGTLLGIGAMKALGDGTSEIKSMRTAQAALGRGVGTAILREIMARARARGDRALVLETGTGPAFDAAHALYRRHGFAECGPFGDYVAKDFNRFYALTL
ncbi:GNAT family N-acetyltransferase [Sphingomonas turrisvirgatae]|uniref:GNAT family N-acetyltransferase n=1 Tax=Sphingomonas turrisvirgatae TaxID=1888892 RepID=A0A1E3LYF6_9SPHN|nr:GNAT family N-acetyltransferase [Sphingomonas turrisvirgatae]